MKKTLQDQYLLIKEGKGHKGVFLADAKRDFPHIVPNAATFNEAVASLKTKNIISENIIGLSAVAGYEPRKKETYETAFEAFLAEARKAKENEDEKVKAEEKKVSKPVEKDLEHNFDNKDDKNPDNLIFGQIMMGYYTEMKDPKNTDKTMQQIKDIVLKNLAKDPIHYTKDGQFGVKDLGYTTEAPGLGTPKEPKGKYKSSGYGDLKESKESWKDEFKKEPSKKFSDEEIKAKLKAKREAELERRRKAGESLEEITLRRAIQEMIDAELEEATQMTTIIRPKTSDKEREERDPKDQSPAISQKLENYLRSKNYIKISGNTVLFLARLFNKENFKKLPIDTDVDSDFVSFLNKASTIGGKTVKLPVDGVPQDFIPVNNVFLNRNERVSFFKPAKKSTKEGVLGVRDTDVKPASFPDLPISYSDDKNVAHYSDDYRYGSQEDLLDVEDYIEQIQGMSDGDAFNYLEELGLERDEILTVLKSRKSSLRESVEKDLAAINKEAEHEVLQSKLDKIQDLIDKRQSQLGKLDEDEDMKALTDKKKVKELEKDIKKLEQAKAKVEKILSKTKGKKKEVIDETEDDMMEEMPLDDNMMGEEMSYDENY